MLLALVPDSLWWSVCYADTDGGKTSLELSFRTGAPADVLPCGVGQPKRTPAAITRSISARAISGFVRAVRYSVGTPARSNRARLLVQLSGRNNRNARMTGTSPRASVRDTRGACGDGLPHRDTRRHNGDPFLIPPCGVAPPREGRLTKAGEVHPKWRPQMC
jgi:hypothetical protein